MVTALVIAITLTICVSAMCSLLEAMILSTTTAEIEGLKVKAPHQGEMLQTFKQDIETTSSAILSLNTIANTAGAVVTGGLAVKVLGDDGNVMLYFSIAMTAAILLFSEVIPKNMGVIYRPGLQPYLVYPLAMVRFAMKPIAFTCRAIVRLIIRRAEVHEVSEEEIRLLSEKGSAEGSLTHGERDLIRNALSLDDVTVSEIMTPRTVVTGFEKTLTVDAVFHESPNIPFARLPVYDDSIDNIVGVVRRRDLLKAKAEDKDEVTVEALMNENIFVPENATGADALEVFLKSHQQLAVVVDEYGSVAGVVTMEDVIEHILGREIFEDDDPAIDMRELARNRHKVGEKSKTAAKNAIRAVEKT